MALFRRKTEEDIEEVEEIEEEEYEEDEESEEGGLKDYSVYYMGRKEKLFYIFAAAAAIFAVGMIFYQNAIVSALLALAALLFPKIRTKQIIAKQKKELNLQFKDLLYSLASSMSSGRSLEGSFKDAIRDLSVIYPDEETPIIEEIRYIVRCIETNMTVEDAISQFAKRAHIEDIQNFSDVIKTCKRSGGNLIEVVRSTSQIISDKIETKGEIETLITAKKFESRIMMCTPIFMVAILSATSPEYMAPVFDFSRVIGPIVMTIAIIMFVISFFIGEKIMNIEV